MRYLRRTELVQNLQNRAGVVLFMLQVGVSNPFEFGDSGFDRRFILQRPKPTHKTTSLQRTRISKTSICGRS